MGSIRFCLSHLGGSGFQSKLAAPPNPPESSDYPPLFPRAFRLKPVRYPTERTRVDLDEEEHEAWPLTTSAYARNANRAATNGPPIAIYSPVSRFPFLVFMRVWEH